MPERRGRRENKTDEEGSTWENETQRGAARDAEAGRRIRAAAVDRSLGINVDTLYGWRGREKERVAALESTVGGRIEAELAAENKALWERLK